jgi:5'-nucleotidase
LIHKRYALKGTPTDCVIMGVHELMPEKPDLILSGVNHGQNLAEDVIYSGTVAGALEGCILGYRSIALSQCYAWDEHDSIVPWECARAHGAELIARLLRQTWAPNTILNINFPDCAPERVTGMAVTRQGRRTEAMMRIDERRDGRNNPYYWIGFHRHNLVLEEGTDLKAVRDHQISVTPLSLDMTHHNLYQSLKEALS